MEDQIICLCDQLCRFNETELFLYLNEDRVLHFNKYRTVRKVNPKKLDKLLVLSESSSDADKTIYRLDSHLIQSMLLNDEYFGIKFLGIVIRNDALMQKYPGGLRRFLQNVPVVRFNQHITVLEGIMDSDAGYNSVISMLLFYGLISSAEFIGSDFHFLTISISRKAEFMGKADPEPDIIQQVLPVSWLKGTYNHHGLYIAYRTPKKPEPFLCGTVMLDSIMKSNDIDITKEKEDSTEIVYGLIENPNGDC